MKAGVKKSEEGDNGGGVEMYVAELVLKGVGEGVWGRRVGIGEEECRRGGVEQHVGPLGMSEGRRYGRGGAGAGWYRACIGSHA